MKSWGVDRRSRPRHQNRRHGVKRGRNASRRAPRQQKMTSRRSKTGLLQPRTALRRDEDEGEDVRSRYSVPGPAHRGRKSCAPARSRLGKRDISGDCTHPKRALGNYSLAQQPRCHQTGRDHTTTIHALRHPRLVPVAANLACTHICRGRRAHQREGEMTHRVQRCAPAAHPPRQGTVGLDRVAG